VCVHLGAHASGITRMLTLSYFRPYFVRYVINRIITLALFFKSCSFTASPVVHNQSWLLATRLD